MRTVCHGGLLQGVLNNLQRTIYRAPGFIAIDLAPRLPSSPRQQLSSLSLTSWLRGGGRRRWATSKLIRPREILALNKSFSTLWHLFLTLWVIGTAVGWIKQEGRRFIRNIRRTVVYLQCGVTRIKNIMLHCSMSIQDLLASSPEEGVQPVCENGDKFHQWVSNHDHFLKGQCHELAIFLKV